MDTTITIIVINMEYKLDDLRAVCVILIETPLAGSQCFLEWS